MEGQTQIEGRERWMQIESRGRQIQIRGQVRQIQIWVEGQGWETFWTQEIVQEEYVVFNLIEKGLCHACLFGTF